MIKRKAYTKKFPAYELAFYGAIGLGITFLDFIFNALKAIGILGKTHPHDFGTFQSIILAFCVIRIFQKLDHWRHYA